MSNEKIAIPREVATAIENARRTGVTNYRIMEMAEMAISSATFLAIQRWAFGNGGGTPELLMEALVNGYTIDRSPEEKVREYYVRREEALERSQRLPNVGDESYIRGEIKGITATLHLLGIKIEGVNV